MRLNLASRYKRWRRGRGFGIHSPFAYDFIIGTLRERLPYYSYHKFDALAAAHNIRRAEQRRLRLIFRVAVRVNPQSAAVVGGDSLGMFQRFVLRSVRRDMGFASAVQDSDLVIINEDISLPQGLPEKAVWIFPDTTRGGSLTCESLWADCRHAMRFDNSHGFSIIVNSPALPRQRFDVSY